MAAAGTLGSAMLSGGPASAAPEVGVPGCTFDAGATTCTVDEPIRAAITTPYAYCIEGQTKPIRVWGPMTTIYLRTITTWQGFYVNDHQRFLGTTTYEWTETIPGHSEIWADGPDCPLAPPGDE